MEGIDQFVTDKIRKPAVADLTSCIRATNPLESRIIDTNRQQLRFFITISQRNISYPARSKIREGTC